MSNTFIKGASIEYKYKNKDWKNGIIKNKTNTHMIIIIHKNIEKQKQIELRMCDVITLLHIKKALKLSNQFYPQGIAIHTTVKIVYTTSNRPAEIAKIGHYRDNKSITFYFPKQKHVKRFLTIKQKHIKTIDDYGITTHDGRRIVMVCDHTATQCKKLDRQENFSFFMKLQNILKDLYAIPSEIGVMIYEYAISAAIRMYEGIHNAQVIQPVKIWPANTISVYGAEFTPAIDILCRGVEIHAQFGKVKTYAILSVAGNYKSYKGIMDTIYDEQDDIRRFIWENDEVIKLNKGAVCKIGFFISDGASVTKYVKYKKDSPLILKMNNFDTIKWQFMNRNTNLERDKPFETSYDWYPFVRLLI